MAEPYFGLSIVLLVFLLAALCAALIWLALDSYTLWKQFRDRRVGGTMVNVSPRPSNIHMVGSPARERGRTGFSDSAPAGIHPGA